MPVPHSNEQKALLRELAMNPIWTSILADIDAMCARPRYKLTGDKSHDDKVAEMIYRSAVDDTLEKVLLYLGYDR
jgi:hypothetical protein